MKVFGIIILVVFVISCIYSIIKIRKDKKKIEQEQKRREELRRKRITSQPARPRNDSRNEIVNNRSTFTTDKVLSENLDNKTKSDYQAFSSGLESSLSKMKPEKKIYEAYFKDNWGEGVNDYSYMSAAQARGEVSYMKRLYGYIDWADYGDLLDAIAAEKDDKYLDLIQSKTPEEVEKWFKSNLKREIRMSQFIWREVGKILAPIHEATLLDGMEHCSVRSIESYVKNRKQEGYFFTQKAYDLANSIYSGAYDPVAIRVKSNAPEKNLKEKIRRTKNNIEQAISNNETAKIEKYQTILKKCENDLEELLSKK